MGAKKRILLTASAIILLCLTLLIGVTLALFSDGVTVRNHLVAGDLEADLWRVNLEYTSLNSTGKLEKTTVTSDLNLSDTKLPEINIFGLDSSGIIVVPQSYIKADMELRNTGNVAFDYVVKLVFVDDTAVNDAFAKQLEIVITDPNGNNSKPVTLDKFIKDGKDYILFKGELLAKPGDEYTMDSFSVKVTFVDNDATNNSAQAATATFDLIVEAVQATD